MPTLALISAVDRYRNGRNGAVSRQSGLGADMRKAALPLTTPPQSFIVGRSSLQAVIRTCPALTRTSPRGWNRADHSRIGVGYYRQKLGKPKGSSMRPITVVLTEGYSDWQIAPLCGAGRAFYEAEFRFVSPTGGALTSAAGLPIAETARFEAPDDGVVVVCGGPAFEADDGLKIGQKLRQARQSGCIIAGICGATIALARAGMLNDVSHTSNGPDYLRKYVEAYSGTGRYVDKPKAVRDKDIITAPAPAPASFASEVLAAAGLEPRKAEELKSMLGAEHSS